MTGSKPWPRSLRHRPLHERELEHHEVAAQVGEARARQPRAALHVDPLAGELEVVAPGLRRRRRRRAGPRPRARRPSGRAGSAASTSSSCSSASAVARALAERLDLGRQRLQALELRGHVALLALAGRDLLGRRLLLGAQPLGRLRRLAPLRVELDDAVDALGELGPAPRERRANRLGLAADQPEVEHGARRGRRRYWAAGRARRHPAAARRRCPRTWPGTPRAAASAGR